MSYQVKRFNQHSQRVGATAVEMAICLPLLFLLLFGSYELARANMMRHATEAAAYEGARVGILPGTDRRKIEDACELILSSVGISNFSIDVTPKKFDNRTETVIVEIDVPFRGNTSVSSFFVQDPTFRGRCEMRREIF